MVVRGLDVCQSRDDEQTEHEELDHDQDVVRTRALAHTQQEQPRDEADDQERGQVHENRNPRDMGCTVEQSVDLGIGTQ